MDLELRRKLFRLIAGVLFVDRRLDAAEDVFLARLCAELELSQGERQTLKPVADPSEATRAMRA
ncbi:MAG TPA: hypothetical protein VFB62_04900, partial [Polyangiaceae bacterium]|nr:hypothetical protein [Polyangiaceae bacterium]